MNKIVLSVIVLSLLSFSAYAKKTKAERREQRQEARIEQGVQSGQLTEKEASKLQAGQEKIDQAQEAAASDGTVTKKEKRHINKMQNKESKKIRKQKND